MLIDEGKCVGCESCQPYCPVGAIHTVPPTTDIAAREAGGKPPGPVVDPSVREEVARQIGQDPKRRDLLVEYLHRIQDHRGCIPTAHLAALAEALGISRAEAYEVATFYAHFDVVHEGEAPPRAVTIRVCSGVSCQQSGGGELLQALSGLLGDEVRVVSTPCVGACETAPVAVAGQRRIGAASVQSVADALAAGTLQCDVPAYRDLEAYRNDGGYGVLQQCVNGTRSRDAVIGEVEQAGLRGRGGAGFPVARKWRALAEQPKPRYLVVNADEGEPGTFKDRHCLETEPHRVLEGALIAAWAVEAEEVFFYLRDEYAHIRAMLERELPRLEAAGLLPGVRIHLRRGAGSYVCGEETALLESLEGRRGHPRLRPPFPAQAGLFGQPTLVSNVESLYWVAEVLERGAQWFVGQGRPRFFSVSGRVKEPGVKMAPSDISARQLIEEHCGGMLDGHRLAGVLPGGASGGILPASMADLPLDAESLAPHDCAVGSAGVVVLSDKDDVPEVVRNVLRFFQGESCGQCAPCREGVGKLLQMAEAGFGNGAAAVALGTAMRDTSTCGLGQAAPNAVLSALRFFPGEMK